MVPVQLSPAQIHFHIDSLSHDLWLRSLLCINSSWTRCPPHLVTFETFPQRNNEPLSVKLFSSTQTPVWFIQNGHTGLFTPLPFTFPSWAWSFETRLPFLLDLALFNLAHRCEWAAPSLLHCPWGHLFSIAAADWSHARCESCRVGGCRQGVAGQGSYWCLWLPVEE